MSSNAGPSLCKIALVPVAFALSMTSVAPLTAQDDAGVTHDPQDAEEAEGTAEPPAPAQRTIIDLSVTVPRDESDRLIEKDCEDANDAGRVANEIVVCREVGEASDGSWNKAEWQKRYAEKTKGISTPNTFGIPNHGNPIGFGSPPPPAYMVDFEELPEAPEGSDADRIARGLPPLGQNENLTEEQEKARREALGLKPPPGPLAAPE